MKVVSTTADIIKDKLTAKVQVKAITFFVLRHPWPKSELCG